MVSPQLEDGHTRIANEILEHVPRCRLNGTQLRILLVVWRYTYGFRRKEHEFALSFLADATAASRSQVDREVTALIDRKVLEVVSGGSGRPRVLRFNKNYAEWESANRPRNGGQFAKQTVLQLEYTPSSTLGTEASSTLGTKKERKKNIKKPGKPLKQFAEDSTYFKMATHFYGLVSAVTKELGLEHLTIKANMQRWADDFRKLVEVDKIEDKTLIRDVMRWVTEDDFWRKNVLSAKTFREKFASLAIKMKAESGKKRKPDAEAETRNRQIEHDDALREWVMAGNDPESFRLDG